MGIPLRNRIEDWEYLKAISGRVELYDKGSVQFADACDELERLVSKQQPADVAALVEALIDITHIAGAMGCPNSLTAKRARKALAAHKQGGE